MRAHGSQVAGLTGLCEPRRMGRGLGLPRRGGQFPWRGKNKCLPCLAETVGHREDLALGALPGLPAPPHLPTFSVVISCAGRVIFLDQAL